MIKNTALGVLVLATFVWASAAAANDDDVDECGLYLAISSTSTVEDTHWGLYAGKEIGEGQPVGYPDIGINIPHLRANSYFAEEGDEGGEDKSEILTAMVDFFESFFWVPDTAGAKFELSAGRAVAAIPGAGVLAGYNAKMTNADWNLTSTYHRPSLNNGKPGEAHPNRGANSAFYNVEVVATTNIPPGSEIFMEYGDNWAEEEKRDELAKEDYERIDETVANMIAFFEKHKDNLDQDSKEEIYTFLTKDVMKAAVGAIKARRVTALLPPNPDDLPKVVEAGGALAFSDPTVHRSVDWLKEYGLCMDNIRPGASTIPNAGRGAFATRKIKAGGLVAPVPLTHISDKAVLDMHKLTPSSDGDYMRETDEVVTQQLMVNYCYGHKDSTMLLFPCGAVVSMINHADEPNAKLVWSKHPNHQKLWLAMDPYDLLDEDHMYIGLLMEVVALREINENEEIFIDYGSDWKAAWQKHVASWNEKKGKTEWPVRAVDLNDKYQSKVFESTDEFPENVQLKAFFMVEDNDAKGTVDDPKRWVNNEEDSAFHHENLFDVEVVSHEKTDDADKAMPYTYTVRWSNRYGKSSVVAGIPHEALVFVDKPDTGDQFAPEGFRHPIGIPDEIFPKAWKNLLEEAE